MSKLKPFIIEENISTITTSIVFAKDAKQAQEYYAKDINISEQTVSSITHMSISMQEEAI